MSLRYQVKFTSVQFISFAALQHCVPLYLILQGAFSIVKTDGCPVTQLRVVNLFQQKLLDTIWQQNAAVQCIFSKTRTTHE